jgi:hypothetical protein
MGMGLLVPGTRELETSKERSFEMRKLSSLW